MMIMKNMEPRKFFAGDTIYNDMEEVEEIIFVLTGDYLIGYSINSIEHFALRLGCKTVIGDHSLMFRKRSEFLYRAFNDMDCYAIRKGNF